MDTQLPRTGDPVRHERLLTTLESLLAIQAMDAKSALDQVSDLVARTLGADKVDVFLYDANVDTLVALGTSNTPMGRQQQALGLDRLPLSNGGKTVQIFQTGSLFTPGASTRFRTRCRGSKGRWGYAR